MILAKVMHHQQQRVAGNGAHRRDTQLLTGQNGICSAACGPLGIDGTGAFARTQRARAAAIGGADAATLADIERAGIIAAVGIIARIIVRYAERLLENRFEITDRLNATIGIEQANLSGRSDGKSAKLTYTCILFSQVIGFTNTEPKIGLLPVVGLNTCAIVPLTMLSR